MNPTVQYIQDFIKKILKLFGIGISNYDRLQYLISCEDDIRSIRSMSNAKLVKILSLCGKTESQLKQDVFVISELDFKKDGFFIEFGATNGVVLSNTYLLEKDYGWKGILAEPAKCWHKELKENRNCQIEEKCVWAKSGDTLQFNEVDDAEFSTVSSFSSSDNHGEARKSGKSYDVTTISLTDLLDKHDAPKQIDYLSIDTEGSEYEILRHFDFEKYQIKIITCEHNFQPVREKIYALLTKNDYVRKYCSLSQWDDWYIKN